MSSVIRNDSRDENLIDSWEELHFAQNRTPPLDQASLSRPVFLPGGNQMEKLLLEAQKDSSRSSSRMGSAATSSRGSPKSLHSPQGEPAGLGLAEFCTNTPMNTPQSPRSDVSSPKDPQSPRSDVAEIGLAELCTNRGIQVGPPENQCSFWDSRPEAKPPSDYNGLFQQRAKSKLSVRNTSVMRSSLLNLQNLPILIASHAIAFFAGAAAMFMFLKKYCNWASIAPPTAD